MSRTRLVAGNWKMFKTRGEAAAFCADLRAGLGDSDAATLAICPPFTALDVVVDGLAGSGVAVWAQNGHQGDEGAFTGEVSMGMLADVGVTGVLLGHSERRALFGETDQMLAEKIPAALAHGLTAVLCVGESEAQRDGGATESVLSTQIQGALTGLSEDALDHLVVAYEPVWAIGTGKTATPELAQAAHAHIRAEVGAVLGGGGERLRILYGGSVKPDNAGELLAQPDVDGALVGGASLEAASLLAIAAA